MDGAQKLGRLEYPILLQVHREKRGVTLPDLRTSEAAIVRLELPLVSELRILIDRPDDPDAYFQDFDNSIRECPSKKLVWLTRERELQCLDVDSWNFLKREAHPYLTKRDSNGRGWQQLIDILNQARAHNFLKGMGCSCVRFIPRAKEETPDLEGQLNGLKVLCEVKTINISDDEAAARKNLTGGYTSNCLPLGFFGKLVSSLEKANRQMGNYDGGAGARRLVYIIVNFDDSLAEYKADYYRQIDSYLAENKIPRIEIIFHNEKTAFHSQISMGSATVVNE
jgi:hypothetical protein